MSTEMKGPIAVLNLPEQAGALITYGKKVAVSLKANPQFAKVNPTVPEIEAAVTALDTSETAVGGGPAKTKQRNVDRRALILLLGHARDFVQGLAEQQQSAAEAEAVIVSAGMFVKKVTKPSKAELGVKQGALSGIVLLFARAVAPNAAYYWQWSTDQASWTSSPETMTAKTTINGLVAGTSYFFRFRALTRTGATEWSQVVSFLVK
jgi:hypothetical protein